MTLSQRFAELKDRLEFIRFHSVHLRSRRYIERWQEKGLKRILAHVAENIPLYKAMYARAGVRAADFKTLADITKFPIAYKRQYLGTPMEEYTDNSGHLDGYWTLTSGTSGEPFTILSRAQFKKPLYLESIVYRAFFWTTVFSPETLRIARIMVKTNPRRNRYFVSMSEFLERPRESIQKITRFRPDVLESYSSILQALAQRVEADRLPLRVKYAICGGEDLSPALREYLKKTLGCEAYNRYGMEEFAVVAMECAQHDGMHTNCESLYVEIVDENDAPVPDGTYGRIIVTDMYNTSMPFVRYDTGDHGKMTREACACGRSSPRVWLEGRYSAYLSFHGRRINHLVFDLALESFMNQIIRYVVQKTSEDTIVVKIIPGPAYGPNVEAAIIKNISEVAGEGVSVTVECVEEIPRLPRGKSQIVADLTA